MLKITIESDGGIEAIDLSVEEQKALEHLVVDPVIWIKDAILNKTSKAMRRLVTQVSDKQADKISLAESETIVRDADVKSAKERQEEFEASLPK